MPHPLYVHSLSVRPSVPPSLRAFSPGLSAITDLLPPFPLAHLPCLSEPVSLVMASSVPSGRPLSRVPPPTPPHDQLPTAGLGPGGKYLVSPAWRRLGFRVAVGIGDEFISANWGLWIASVFPCPEEERNINPHARDLMRLNHHKDG